MASLHTPDLAVARWAASGAMWLTGRVDGPQLGPPLGLVDGIDATTRGIRAWADLDPLALLAERAAIAGYGRRGTVSCGGSCRLLPAADGWVAVSLARPVDVGALDAWLQPEGGDGPLVEQGDDSVPVPEARWDRVAQLVAARTVTTLVERARLLQLPVAPLTERPEGARPLRDPVVTLDLGAAPARAELDDVLVVDLTSLWAGPLCGDLLARAGATVVKVESTGRPDGARHGPRPFFDLMNGAKRSVALDLTDRVGIAALVSLVERADVVLEASRPRALEQLGLRADELVAGGGPQVWLSITGYGRGPGAADGVAFGDDAAVAGGLVVRDARGPMFCADAVADPASGLVAARACVDALARGGRWLLDVAMAAVADSLSGPTIPVPDAIEVALPRARPVTHVAPPLGSDTAAVLRGIGIGAGS